MAKTDILDCLTVIPSIIERRSMPIIHGFWMKCCAYWNFHAMLKMHHENNCKSSFTNEVSIPNLFDMETV
jgi:hypothetical protein